MGAYQSTRVLSTTFTCTKRICDAELKVYPSSTAVADNTFRASDEARAAASVQGWTGWRGWRETYEYCPAHKPSKTAEVRPLW